MSRENFFHTGLASEGDINMSSQRTTWQNNQLDDATRARIDADARHYLHQSMSTPCMNALRVAHGIYLEDLRGRRIMDFHGNIAHQVGFAHPDVVAAVKRQMDTLAFCPRRYTNDPAIAAARRLAERAPGDLSRVLFAPGGATAMGIALKLARVATGRFKTLSMWEAFHGAALDTISIGGEAVFRRNMGPLLPGTEHAPPCDPQDCPFGCGKECNLRCAAYVEYVLAKEGDIGAVIVETIRSTDAQIPPRAYYQRVRAACDKHGALLILDEIPIGLGRTGAFFAFEHYGIVPDMVVLGKGLGGALMPLAAVLAREELDVAGHVSLGHYTHEKSPLGCAAALATLDVIEREGLVARARKLGGDALRQLDALKDRHTLVGDVRGIGLLLGVELVSDRATMQPAPAAAEKVMYKALAKGLNFKVGQGNVINLAPPLIISDAELARAIAVLDAALTETEAEI
jgi:4-aminobutyrate aminotransferase